uniref:alpha-1,2-Mannosidase n=1 Tax=Cacopsylla melanoneura TaxID=428564 RepID=A0A8D8YDS9_9HEMI
MMLSFKLLPSILLLVLILNNNHVLSIREYTKQDLDNLKQQVKEVFYHAYNGYLNFAFPYDELRPLSCDGIDTWGSYSLTLIDALDTLAIMGNYTEFARVVQLITERANFDTNINVSVFETNIRIVGGLLSAHLFSEKAGLTLEPGWPCNGPLLRLAEDVARRLLPAFDTETGMPYGTVNLRYGVPLGETSVTCTAGVGTYIVEFGTLSRLTGDPIYEEVALNALRSLYKRKSNIGLFGNHIDTKTGVWTAQDSGIGAGVDSYFEYLVKGAILFQQPELLHMFNEVRKPIDKYLKRDDWYLWVSMHKGQVTLPVFQSLEAFWPGVLSLVGDISTGMKSLHNYHQVWKQYGFLPEFYNIVNSEAGVNRDSYPLRPELIESVMYLHRATGDPFLLDIGVDMLRSIQHSAQTPCGYATIKNIVNHSQEDRMESFFLSETTKYLYLLFDTENFIHNDGNSGKMFETDAGNLCVLGAGGYIFNTEAHPIDLSALHCCSSEPLGDVIVDSKKEKRNESVMTNEVNGSERKVEDENNNTDDADKDNEEAVLTTNAETKDTNTEGDDFKSKEDLFNDSLNIITKDLAKLDLMDRKNMYKTLHENVLKIRENQKKIDELVHEDLMSIKQGLESTETTPVQRLQSLEKLQRKLEELKEEHKRIKKVNDFLDVKLTEIMDKQLAKTLGNENRDEENGYGVGKVDEIKIDSQTFEFDHLDNESEEIAATSLKINEDMSDVKISVNSSMYLVEENQTGSENQNTDKDQENDQEPDECVGLEGDPLALCKLAKYPPAVFNSQRLLEKIRLQRSNEIAGVSMASYEVLSCPPQPFFTRFTLRGEFFETPP